MQQQKEVKIINFKATKFGVFQALELDFNKFQQGAIAIKGNAGAGKSTVQNGLKTNIQGRNTLADADQYGEEWELETQLLDGERSIFIGAVKKPNKSIDYKLYEKDTEGKKVMTPVIDGLKATPAKYMDLIATELTFGIRDFLSTDATTHRKFMFKLFRPELEKLGVIFDKKDSSYETSILGQLDALTYDRDKLRSECTHRGAYVADFERDGFKKTDLDILEAVEVSPLENKRNNLLVKKGQASGNSNADFQKKKSDIITRGQKITDEIRVMSEGKASSYNKKELEFSDIKGKQNGDKSCILKAIEILSNSFFIDDKELEAIENGLNVIFNTHYTDSFKIKAPIAPICPEITDGILKNDDTITYDPDFLPLIEKAKAIRVEYSALQLEPVDLAKFDNQIEEVDNQILAAKAKNDLVQRYEINRQWVEADGKVNQKRKELAKLYAQIDTGVEGLYMKPFFNEEKMEIKTVYTGVYDPDFFKNDDKNERLLVSYSSTQMPLIGILLQVARLKKKSKALKYIFLDDVPMDSKSRAIIGRIASENGLSIITSLTGDFDKEKLTENELLVEGGEVFFNE